MSLKKINHILKSSDIAILWNIGQNIKETKNFLSLNHPSFFYSTILYTIQILRINLSFEDKI